MSVLAWQIIGWVILWVEHKGFWPTWRSSASACTCDLKLEHSGHFLDALQWLSSVLLSTELQFLLAIGSASAYPLLLPLFACPSQLFLYFLVLSPSTFTPPKPILTGKVPRWCPKYLSLSSAQMWRGGKTSLALALFLYTGKKKAKPNPTEKKKNRKGEFLSSRPKFLLTWKESGFHC